MKKHFILLSLYLLILSSCDERGVTMFDQEHEVYFEKFFMNALAPGTEAADSTEISFFFAEEDEKYMDAFLEVNLSGRPLSRNLHFGLKVIKDKTTALPNEYILEKEYVFRARPIPENATAIKDTIAIRFLRSERLKDMPDGIRLEIALTAGAETGVGQYERSHAVIILREEAIQPEWWTQEVEAELLGKYTAKKYKVFLRNIEGSRELDGKMIENRPDQARKLVLRFKKWLEQQNPPIYEEDGTPMKVEV